MADHFDLLSAYFQKKIKSDQFYAIGLQNNEQVSSLSPELQQLYIDYINACSQSFKNDEETLWNIAKIAGGTFINTFMSGFIGFGLGMADALSQGKEIGDTSNMCIKNRNAFLDKLMQYGISSRWMDFQASLLPQEK